MELAEKLAGDDDDDDDDESLYHAIKEAELKAYYSSDRCASLLQNVSVFVMLSPK
jgi:hypothetical protein